MLPMASSSSSSSSSSSATVAVDKATSDLLISPDWTMNIDICDSVNSHHWQAKDVVKALKRRLQHKNAKVQLLSLTLLETMVKNCGDYLHFQVAERNVLGEMIKIVKKKADMQVREKILALLDSWQEAFGGPGGKYPQYYWAYEELRRSGVEFPKRSLDTSPIFTPPASHPVMGRPQPGYGMPSNASRRLDETMATEIESLSLSSIEAMRNISELLGDMLQAVNQSDRAAVKDEVIVELVNRCRTNQKKLMQMLTSTGDEELLARGLELNDGLQSLLAKYDAIASGSPLPSQLTSSSPQRTETSASSVKQSEVRDSCPRDSSPRPNVNPPAPVTTAITRSQMYDDEEEEDEFAQLARRHSKAPSAAPQNISNGVAESLAIVSVSTVPSTQSPSTSNALALPDPPAPVNTKEQDIIDLLSITLSTTGASPHTSHTPPLPNQTVHQPPVAPTPSTQAYPHASQPYPGAQGQVAYTSYVVPWAQQPQPEPPQPRAQAQPPTYSSPYPPPPWAATPVYYSNQSHMGANNPYAAHTNTMSYAPVQPDTTPPYTPAPTARPLQSYSSFTQRQNGFAANGESQASTGVRTANTLPTAQKPFVPSYRLFEDLNVFGSADGRMKMPSSNASSSLAGAPGQGMVGGRK